MNKIQVKTNLLFNAKLRSAFVKYEYISCRLRAFRFFKSYGYEIYFLFPFLFLSIESSQSSAGLHSISN